jgi:hypothetical protein
MSQSFGYLNKAGYGGHQFPIIIGETGTTFLTVSLQGMNPNPNSKP